jgi:hypothetical protein
MYGALQTALVVLAISSPGLLLVGHFIWPTRFPWWLVVIGTAAISTLLGWALDEIGWYAHFERTDRCFEEYRFDEGCSVSYHVATLPMYLKWVSGITILALLLPIYFLSWRIRARRHKVARPNNSLERTRGR